MTRDTLERHQVWVYLVAILAGLAVGGLAPGLGPFMEVLLWPSLAALLYATFTQVPLAHLPAAFRDMRFMSAVLAGNFVVLPVLVWGLLALVPDVPAVRLGVLLVLLVPCTDWFITFAHQGGGDARRAIAVTPVVLLVQIVLLPVYLWLLMGDGFSEIVSAERMVTVFLVVIVVPLALAYLTERWVERDAARAAVIGRLGWLPVPLLALVVLLIAGSQVEAVLGAVTLFGDVLAAFVAFLAGAAACGVALGRLFSLPAAQARTLLFSLATRNSFVVLPFALALPAGWEATAIVIVLQSLVELIGMLLFLWLVPRLLIPDRAAG
ncbi:arsenic resistance protein [Hyphomicrobium sp.]|uniref:arsenic resistance protein n=1 Tax=Hyphomicrobium sp. TaxID=82 RepID=UPI0025C172A3|nr:arsenic resistance protein [Hyphomicrobium sp.]MCC7253208.1 arsenic resistance protein [Hyphomicrobium sp.]